MRVILLPAFSCVLAAAIALAGCGGDGPQSPRGFSPDYVGAASSSATVMSRAIGFKWAGSTIEIPPKASKSVLQLCPTGYPFVLAGAAFGGKNSHGSALLVINYQIPYFSTKVNGWKVSVTSDDSKYSDPLTVYVSCAN
jgi:hypothetical protein